MFLSQIIRFFQFCNCSVNIYNKWTLQRVVCVTIIVTFFTDTTVYYNTSLVDWTLYHSHRLRVLYFYSSSTRQLFSAPEGNFSSWQAAVSMTSCKNLLMGHSFGISNASRILAGYQIIDFTLLLLYFISGTVLDWIASYLTGRTQFVRFNGQSSKTVPVTSGVPQGSVLGPILFLTYTAAVVLVVRKHGFNVHAYADDLQIYDHTAPSGMASLLQRMAVCIEDVSTWMSSNRLCLNPSKTELVWLGSSRRLQNCATDTEMSVLGSLIRPVDSVRDLGVLIDSGLTLSDHVNKVAALCYFHIRQLPIVRRTLTDEVAHSLVPAFIHNRIDYCNGILASSPKYLTEKLQSVLRVAARLVLRLPSRSPVSTLMRDQLHWLSVESRVKFKLALLAYKSVHGLAPEYLSAYCVPVSRMPGRTHLRSAGQWTMLVPRTKTVTIGPRGFYCSCHSV